MLCNLFWEECLWILYLIPGTAGKPNIWCPLCGRNPQTGRHNPCSLCKLLCHFCAKFQGLNFVQTPSNMNIPFFHFLVNTSHMKVFSSILIFECFQIDQKNTHNLNRVKGYIIFFQLIFFPSERSERRILSVIYEINTIHWWCKPDGF